MSTSSSDAGKRSSPSVVKRLLAELEVRPRKAWGQHFLCDENVARRIVSSASLAPGESVLEIGPGLGALTQLLLEAGATVLAVERDPVMVRALAPLGATVIEADFLRLDLSSLLGDAGPWKVVGNLPYYITTPILEKLLELGTRISLMVLTMQTEVADRLLASPGSKAYGALSLFAQYHAAVSRAFTIAPTCFYPPPEVESTVVTLTPLPPRLDPAGERAFRSLVRAGFSTRRKTLRNALSPLGPSALTALAASGIDPQRRAETLSLEEFLAVAKVLAADRL